MAARRRDSRANIIASRRSFLTLRREVAPDHKTARAGFVDDVQWRAVADELAQRLVQRGKIAPDTAHMPNLAVAAGLGHGDVDAVLVNVQSDVHAGARFTHGPSPRKFATTRPTIGPVHWCSSVGLVPATYGVAGGGPPLLTKPSCLAAMSNDSLRADLSWITSNSVFAATETGYIERLRMATHHSIQVLSSPGDNLDYNCVMYAFDLVEYPQYGEAANTALVQRLIETGEMIEQSDGEASSLCVYFDGEHVVHIGCFLSSCRVRSKWGGRQLYEHSLFEVPQEYGSMFRAFSVPGRDAVLSLLNLT